MHGFFLGKWQMILYMYVPSVAESGEDEIPAGHD